MCVSGPRRPPPRPTGRGRGGNSLAVGCRTDAFVWPDWRPGDTDGPARPLRATRCPLIDGRWSNFDGVYDPREISHGRHFA